MTYGWYTECNTTRDPYVRILLCWSLKSSSLYEWNCGSDTSPGEVGWRTSRKVVSSVCDNPIDTHATTLTGEDDRLKGAEGKDGGDVSQSPE